VSWKLRNEGSKPWVSSPILDGSPAAGVIVARSEEKENIERKKSRESASSDGRDGAESVVRLTGCQKNGQITWASRMLEGETNPKKGGRGFFGEV